MSGFDSPVKILIVFIIALVVLGPKRLPEVGRSLGHGIREFKDSVSGIHEEIGGAHEEVAGRPGQPVAATPAEPPVTSGPASQ